MTGEFAVAAIGSIALLNGDANVGAVQRDAAMTMPSRIKRRIRELLRGSEPEPASPRLKVRTDVKAATALLLSAAWTEPVATQAVGVLTNISQLIDRTRPNEEIKGLFSLEQVPVSSFERGLFADLEAVFDAPLNAIELAASNALLPAAASVAKLAWPDTYNYIMETAGSEVALHMARRGKVPTAFERGLTVLASLPQTYITEGTHIAPAIGQKKPPTEEQKRGTNTSLAPKSQALDSERR